MHRSNRRRLSPPLFGVHRQLCRKSANLIEVPTSHSTLVDRSLPAGSMRAVLHLELANSERSCLTILARCPVARAGQWYSAFSDLERPRSACARATRTNAFLEGVQWTPADLAGVGLTCRETSLWLPVWEEAAVTETAQISFDQARCRCLADAAFDGFLVQCDARVQHSRLYCSLNRSCDFDQRQTHSGGHHPHA